MLKEILGTIGTRYVIAILNLALIFINAKILGLEGIGTVGLIVASVNIVVMFNGILSGNTIVYFMNKYSIHTLFPIAIIWTFIGSAIACGTMELLGLLPNGYWVHIYWLAILNSLVAANTRFLLGKDKIIGFNITYVLQGGLLFFVLLLFYFVFNKQEVGSYITGLYITNGIAFAASMGLLLPSLLQKETQFNDKVKSKSAILKEMFAYGLWGSADNMAETFTTRLNYFMVERFLGLGYVGLLDAGTKISESVWHISRSVAFIEYNRVAKTSIVAEQKKVTLQLFKLTFFALAAVMGGILLIPEWVYTDYLLSPEFTGIRSVIIGLSVGIVALGCNSILSHFFIGSGHIKFSTLSSCVGLTTLLIAGYLLIPHYGVTGSAVSTSIAFSAMLLTSLFIFTKQTNASFRDFVPNKEDWTEIQSKLKRD